MNGAPLPAPLAAPRTPASLLIEATLVLLVTFGLLFVGAPLLSARVDAGWLHVGAWFLGPFLAVLFLREDPERLGYGLGDLRAGLVFGLACGVLAAAFLIAAVWAVHGFEVAFEWSLLWARFPHHLLNVALPEEVFFRGYLQARLEQLLPPRFSALGARLGSAWVLTALIFAVGHLLEGFHPARLLTFFPGLLFGFLRVRTRSVLAPALFHAWCNALVEVTGPPW